MHHIRLRGLCVLLLAIQSFVLADEPTVVRTDQRVLWTQSRIQGSPDPRDPYQLEVAFPRLSFELPIDLVQIPGTDRLAVVEHQRGIRTFQVDPEVRQADVMLDLTQAGVQLFAAAFHPRFAENGWAFFTYGDAQGVHLARVHCSLESGAPRAEADSQQVVFSWPTGGHTGGCIRFGPDGYLYLATGDGSGHSDTNLYAQDINDPRGSILRLDVDHGHGDRLYQVPADNPFVDRPAAVAEIFAYGLRQPWKFSFDKQGQLWAGDVGQDLWEMVHLVTKAGNYGWSITEGTHPFRPERKRGPTAIIPPVVEHHHTEFRSITGGHVYMGSRLDELRGAYIYGDFDTGRIWMLRYADGQVTAHQQLARTQSRIVGFGQDLEGEVYVVGYASGKIYRLKRLPIVEERLPDFPRKLSETGLFTSTVEETPAPGVISYSVNAPNFSDGAVVRRYLGLPGAGRIEFDALLYPRGPGAPPGWRFPDGSVLVQTFALPVGAGDDAGLRRIETRILHHERMSGSDDDYGAQIWHGYTYVWNDEQTDAELAPADGLDRRLMVTDEKSGEPRQLTWHIPSRNECAVCHNIASKHVIGMNTLQMNRLHDYGGQTENQLAVFERLGLFAKPITDRLAELPRLVDYTDDNYTLDDRARSYLHANCSHCHRQWGGGNSSFQLMVTLPLNELNISGVSPAHGTFGIADARLIAPGAPERSVLLYRLLSVGSARMPRLGASTVDVAGARLIHDWIAGLPAETDPPSLAAWELPADLLNGETAQTSTIDPWLANTSLALRLVQAIDAGEVSGAARDWIIERAAATAESEVLDLFDRYLPEEKRQQRLGGSINPDAILTLDANAQRGASLFFESKTLQCQNCHQINGRGKQLGPDLSHIGKQSDAYRILDSIVNPSREIKPEYQVYLVQTVDGRVLSGLRLPTTGDDVVLRDANNQESRLAAGDVELIQPQQQSLMPDAQIRSMTAQQLADLIAFLSSLK